MSAPAVGEARRHLGGMLDADLKVIGHALETSQDDDTAIQALVNVKHAIDGARNALRAADTRCPSCRGTGRLFSRASIARGEYLNCGACLGTGERA